MARSVVISNGGLTVGLNESGLVHDFYYPYVGLENLTTARVEPHHIGVYVDGMFSWIHSSSWEKKVLLHDDAMASSITMINNHLKIELQFCDFIDKDYDVFARDVKVINHADRSREIRLFFHQNFQISADGRADTAMYVPEGNYILDYKGRCSILAYAESRDGSFDQYAVGNAGIEGKQGTFRDAEDGELSMSTVEHASVDSTLRIKVDIAAHGAKDIHYWLVVASSQIELEKIHDLYKDDGFNVRKDETIRYWQAWLEKSAPKYASVSPEYAKAVRTSLLTIKAHMDTNGGIIASCDSSIYNYGRDYYSYVWPRDGAYVIWPLIKLGYTTEAVGFFNFCRDIMHPDGYMMHKYQPDRAIGSTWHPLLHGKRKELAIQEDETASILFMLGEYHKYTNDNDYIERLYVVMIRPMADFLCQYKDVETGLPHASYDLWEEKFLTSTYTTANTYAGLKAAALFAQLTGRSDDEQKWLEHAEALSLNAYKLFHMDNGYYSKGFILTESKELKFDTTLDVSSFYGVFMFNFGDRAHTEMTLKSIEEQLLDISPSKGSARYVDDNYFKSDPPYKGNPWFVTTLWLAQYYARNGQVDKAHKYIQWALDNTLPSGLLSEQISPQDSKIVGVTPLVWSHAELINTILDVN